MALKQASERRTPRIPATAVALLDGFFVAFSDNEGGVLAARVCEGVVTGAALAERLKWTRDKVSRRSDSLRAGGVLEKRRDHGWMRMTPQLAGVEAAQAWITTLRAEAPPSAFPDPAPDERLRRALVLADEGRRRLLSAMRAAPGSTQVELVRACGLSQPIASRGLIRLVDTGFARVERIGGRARYTLRAEAVESLWAWTQSTKTRLAAGRETASRVMLPRPEPKMRSVAKIPSPPVHVPAVAATSRGGGPVGCGGRTAR